MADSLNTLVLPENRVDLENLIETAIERLDAMDGDEDDEDDGTAEPWLGCPERHSGSWRGAGSCDDDRECDDCDDEDSFDREEENYFD